MYYYIMESANKKNSSWQEKVKNILGDLGIAGETVSPNSARTIEELTMLGIIKGYSTIVAVGPEKLVNRIVTTIINQKDNKDVVLGILPENFNTPLSKKINVSDLREACNTLKYRRLETFGACYVEPNKYFITEAVIESKRPAEGYFITSQIQAGIQFNKITIKPGMKIYVEDGKSQNKSRGFFSWFKKDEGPDINSSFFHTAQFKLEIVDQSLPVKVEDDIISKTPIVCHNHPKALKVIVARDIMNAKNDNIN